MYKIDRMGRVQKSYTRTDPNYYRKLLCQQSKVMTFAGWRDILHFKHLQNHAIINFYFFWPVISFCLAKSLILNPIHENGIKLWTSSFEIIIQS